MKIHKLTGILIVSFCLSAALIGCNKQESPAPAEQQAAPAAVEQPAAAPEVPAQPAK